MVYNSNGLPSMPPHQTSFATATATATTIATANPLTTLTSQPIIHGVLIFFKKSFLSHRMLSSKTLSITSALLLSALLSQASAAAMPAPQSGLFFPASLTLGTRMNPLLLELPLMARSFLAPSPSILAFPRQSHRNAKASPPLRLLAAPPKCYSQEIHASLKVPPSQSSRFY